MNLPSSRRGTSVAFPGRVVAVLALAVGLMALVATVRAAGEPLIDNQRVTVWDTAKSQPQQTGQDRVVIDVTTSPSAGTVSFQKAGGSGPAVAKSSRSIIVEFKNITVPALKNTSGFPTAFPRPGSKKLMENDRVVIWDYTWTTGVPTPMHFHDKDVVVTYLADGALQSTEPNGQSVVNPHSYAFTKFNPRDRVHTETLIRGAGRAIIVELK